MMPEKKRSHYQAYMLRMWREDGQVAWRVTLEDPHSGERYGFANMEQLIEFLRELSETKVDNN